MVCYPEYSLPALVALRGSRNKLRLRQSLRLSPNSFDKRDVLASLCFRITETEKPRDLDDCIQLDSYCISTASGQSVVSGALSRSQKLSS